MKIFVTQEDVDNGIPVSSVACPVSLALQRAGFPEVRVGKYSILLDDHQCIDTPDAVVDFIESFDHGVVGLKSFTFELDLQGVTDVSLS